MILDMFFKKGPIFLLVLHQGMIERVSKKVFPILILCLDHKSVGDVEELSGILLIKKAREFLIVKFLKICNLVEIGGYRITFGCLFE